MQERRIQLLKRLMERKDEYSQIKELAEELDCSPRTLRTDIKEVSATLEERGFNSIERRSGVGIRLQIDSGAWKQLMRWIWSLEHHSPEKEDKERRLFVLYQLLMAKQPLTLEKLASEQFVSKPIIREDLNELASICAKYNVKIESIKRAGTTIEGSEVNKRALLSYTVKQLSKYNASEQTLLQFFNSNDVSVVTEALNKVQAGFSIQFSSQALEGLKLHTLFTMKRLSIHQPIELAEDKQNSIRGTTFNDWASELAIIIQEKLALPFPKNEVLYLALHFKTAQLNQENASKESHPKWVEALVGHLIEEVSGLINESLSEEYTLRENLMLHLATTASRLENEFIISNPLLKEIKKEYIYLFHFIQSEVESFFEGLAFFLPEEEVGYLTVHFQTAIERKRMDLSNNVKIGVVCHYGIGVSAFIQARLENYFPNVNQMILIAENEVDTIIRQESLSFILTTIPLNQTLAVPSLQISPLLNEKELKKISEMIEMTEEPTKKREEFPWTLLDYSQPFLIHLQKEFSSSEEVLTFMTEQLEKLGYVADNYTASVLKREQRASTAIGKAIALPHGQPSLVNQSVISCVTLTEPIKWGNEEVNTIFLFAFKKEELKKEETKGFFKFIQQLMEDYTRLNQLKEEDNVMHFLKETYVK